MAKIVSISVSKKKGTPKKQVSAANIVEDHGLENDAHAGKWHRQVSFLAAECIREANDRGLDVGFGDFAENIATEGIVWHELPVGTLVEVGDDVLVEISQIGKECHKPCAIFYRAGDCIMPKKGVFARVLKGGDVHLDDQVRVLDPAKEPA